MSLRVRVALAGLAVAVAASVRPLPPATVRPHGPLRVGFLSNGFGAHPTGLLTVALFEQLLAAVLARDLPQIRLVLSAYCQRSSSLVIAALADA